MAAKVLHNHLRADVPNDRHMTADDRHDKVVI